MVVPDGGAPGPVSYLVADQRPERDGGGIEGQVGVGLGADGERVVQRLAGRGEAEDERGPAGAPTAQPGSPGPDPVLIQVPPGQDVPVVPDRRRAGQHVGLADGETEPRSHGVPERRRQPGLCPARPRPAAGAARTPPAAGCPSPALSAGPRPGPAGVRPGRVPARRSSGRRCRPSAGSRTAGWRPGPGGPGRRASGRVRSGRTRPVPPAARRAATRRRGRPGPSALSALSGHWLWLSARRARSRPSRAGRRSSRPYRPTTAASGQARACTGTSGSGRSTGTPGPTGRPRFGRAWPRCPGTRPTARRRPRSR